MLQLRMITLYINLSFGFKELKAHRNILAARSSVFLAMFEHPLEESVNGKVEIVDVDPEVLALFLKVLYTGK